MTRTTTPHDTPQHTGLVPVPQPRQELHDLTEVRAWARSRGYPVDESARIPLEVLRTYRRVHAA